MKYGVNLNMDQNAIQNAVIQPLTSAPASGVAGQIYFNSTDKKLYQYDGTVWKQVGIASAFSAGEVTANSIPLTLAESDGTTSTVTIVGAGGATLSKSGSTITITTSDNDTTYNAGTLEQLQSGGRIYQLTTDVAIDPEKTYYTRTGTGTTQDPYIYIEVEEPDVEDISTYYELVDTITSPFVWNPVVLSTYVSGLNALAWEHADTALAAAQAAQADADDAADAAASATSSATTAMTMAQSAQADASAASTAAGQAVASAGSAMTAAQNAQADATAASNAASSAVASASTAQDAAQSATESASSAKESADAALLQLANIENVVDVLDWITAHGTMTLTEDQTVNPAHVYFVVDPNGDYVVGGTNYSVVTEPDDDDISTYYELTIDEAVTNYVATHIVVDAEGLWIIPDNSNGNRVLIATGAGSTYTTAGTYIIGTDGTAVAMFATNGARIGKANDTNINISSQSMTFTNYTYGVSRQAFKISANDVVVDSGLYTDNVVFRAWSEINAYAWYVPSGYPPDPSVSNAGLYVEAFSGTADAENITSIVHFYKELTSDINYLYISRSDASAHNLISSSTTDELKPLYIRYTYRKKGISDRCFIGNGDFDDNDVFGISTGGNTVPTFEITSKGAFIHKNTYPIIHNPVSRLEVLNVDTTLTSSSSDTQWLTTLLKAICIAYPSQENTRFVGCLKPNSDGYYEVFIYDTSLINENGLPQYSFGTYRKWKNVNLNFGTDGYTFYVENTNKNYAYILQAQDTRNDNRPPSWYMAKFQNVGGTLTEFKTTSAIGANSLLAQDTHCTLITIVNWHDNSGGRPVQIAVGGVGGVLVTRVASSDSAWGAWFAIQRSLTYTNEFNIMGGVQNRFWFNYRNGNTGQLNGSSANTTYFFANYNGSTDGTTVEAGAFKGKGDDVKMKRVVPLNFNYAHSTAGAWEYTGKSFTVPSGHVYLVTCHQGWNAGRPMGLGLNTSSTTLSGGNPTYYTLDRDSSHASMYKSASWLIYPGTWYLYTWRGTASGGQTNSLWVEGLDFTYY